MIEPKKKICKGKGKYKEESGCGNLTFIFSNGLCKDCAMKANSKSNGVLTSKRSPIKYDRKPTGELELFERIWIERPHVSEISGVKLFDRNHKLWINQFMHVRGKGFDPKNRLNADNIILATWEEHYLYDFQKHKIKDKPEWKFVFERFELLNPKKQ